MIGKLATRNSGIGRQLKPQIYQNRSRGLNRNYNQHNYQNRYRSDSDDRRQYRQDRGRPRYEQNYIVETSEETWGVMVDRIVEESIETIIEMSYDRSRTGLEKGHFPEAITTIEIGVQTRVVPGQDQEQELIVM